MLDDQGNVYYYLNDHLGSAAVVINSSGTVRDKHKYQAFGGSDGSSVVLGQAYRYTGKPLDEEFDLDWYYYGARYYDPSIGRFPSIDPLHGKYPGWSPYAYCLNNPLRLVDPDGRATQGANPGPEPTAQQTENADARVKLTDVSYTDRDGKVKTVKVQFKNTADGKSSDNPVVPTLKTAFEGTVAGAAQETTIESATITATTNGKHSPTSRHYLGKALDIGLVNGVSVRAIGNADPVKALQESFETQAGARENYGPAQNCKSGKQETRKSIVNSHKGHIHFSVD